jgi:hypothetical protein
MRALQATTQRVKRTSSLRCRRGGMTVDSRQSIALPRRWRPKSSAPHRLSGSAARSHSVPPFW